MKQNKSDNRRVSRLLDKEAAGIPLSESEQSFLDEFVSVMADESDCTPSEDELN